MKEGNCLSVSDISLSLIHPRSAYVVENGKFSIFKSWIISVCMCVCNIFTIHSSVDGPFGCFHILANVNNAAVNIGVHQFSSVQFSSLAQSCMTLCDPMNCSTPGLTVHHQLPEFTQTHVHWVGDAIQTSHPLPSPSLPAFNFKSSA